MTTAWTSCVALDSLKVNHPHPAWRWSFWQSVARPFSSRTPSQPDIGYILAIKPSIMGAAQSNPLLGVAAQRRCMD